MRLFHLALLLILICLIDFTFFFLFLTNDLTLLVLISFTNLYSLFILSIQIYRLSVFVSLFTPNSFPSIFTNFIKFYKLCKIRETYQVYCNQC